MKHQRSVRGERLSCQLSLGTSCCQGWIPTFPSGGTIQNYTLCGAAPSSAAAWAASRAGRSRGSAGAAADMAAWVAFRRLPALHAHSHEPSDGTKPQSVAQLLLGAENWMFASSFPDEAFTCLEREQCMPTCGWATC